MHQDCGREQIFARIGRHMRGTGSNPHDRVVLVTGTSSGIGEAIAGHLATIGYRVFGTTRAAVAPGAGSSVEMVTVDVDDDMSVDRGVDGVLRAAGRLDAVINNAGWELAGSVEDTSIEEARAQMETNFFGVLRVCRAALPVMRRQGGGHIVNISSLAGLVGIPFSALYSASKFAVEGLSEALRLEVRRHGIHVVLIEPGDFDSKLAARRRTVKAADANPAYRAAFAAFKANQARREAKAPTPEPIARLVARILDDAAPRARYSIGMPGQRIVVPFKRFAPGRLFETIMRVALGV
jgi:NAD(P)-dependent dehydrogenase (short-subunit alcohol dehydrogenase family)